MERVTVAAVGDITPGFDPLEKGFEYVMEPLRSADVRFAQSERAFSERGTYQQSAGSMHSRKHPRLAAAFKTVPFDVLSICSNHTGDFGPEAVEDTIDTFRALDIATVGAGRTIAEARKPAIIARKGLRIAFLGYVSVIPPQYWATENRAGSAPMRAHTFYEPYEFQPGAPARVVTVPHAADVEQLVRDVKQAKQDADLVFVSLHWGVHNVQRPCDYQPIVAHAAIDAGANAILGHHAHLPQGIEIYKGAVIFYCIGNFSSYKAGQKKGPDYCMPVGEYLQRDVYSFEPDPGLVFEHQRHYNEGGIAFIDVDRDGIARVSYMPIVMNEFGQPLMVRPNEPQFEKSLTYLNWAGKFISGGITQIKAAGGRYEVYARASA